MVVQGQAAGIHFDYHVLTQWQPVESQRLLLWAGRFGLQEEFMTNLNHRHFEHRESASVRATLLNAAEEVGLDRAAAAAFLDTDELEDVVWKSFGDTIRKHGIHSIPFFVYNCDALGASGGPFRAEGRRPPWIVRGSMDEEYFLSLFETIAAEVVGTLKDGGLKDGGRRDGGAKQSVSGGGSCRGGGDTCSA